MVQLIPLLQVSVAIILLCVSGYSSSFNLPESKIGGNIIFIGHAATLDMMVIALKRFGEDGPTEPYQINPHLNRVPYCALGSMRDNQWQVVSPPCPPSLNSSSGRFDWKILREL